MVIKGQTYNTPFVNFPHCRIMMFFKLSGHDVLQIFFFYFAEKIRYFGSVNVRGYDISINSGTISYFFN